MACHAPIRDESVQLFRLAIVFFSVTSFIVVLRFYQRLFLGSGLYSDDYLILLSYVRAKCLVPNVEQSVNVHVHGRSAGYLTRLWFLSDVSAKTPHHISPNLQINKH